MTLALRRHRPLLLLALLFWATLATASGWMRYAERRVPEPAAPQMRCFPPGTILPFTMTLFGPQPGLPGCVDYRLNEGMET